MQITAMEIAGASNRLPFTMVIRSLSEPVVGAGRLWVGFLVQIEAKSADSL